MPRRVLHLVGSPVDEFHADLSRLYARGCLAAVDDPARYETHLAHVGPGGAWSFPDSLDPAALAAAPARSLAEAVEAIAALEVDVVVPHLFCRPGLTAYRSLFEVLGVPLVGNPAFVMALTADKAAAKAVVAAAGVRVPESEVLRRGDAPTLAPPVVVKPVDADNSVGITLVRRPEEWADALEACFAVADRALVERYVEAGREVRCGVLERDGVLVALPLEEYDVDAVRKPIRGYDDKIAPDDDQGLRLVAKDAAHAWIVDAHDPVNAAVQAAALACHRALGCRHYSLFDFRVDPAGEPWFLEAGPYCSFSPQSVVATMAAAAGTALPDLFAQMLDEATRTS